MEGSTEGPITSRKQLVEAEDRNGSSGTAHNEPGVTIRFVLGSFTAVCGAFEFGWNTGVINNPRAVISDFINSTQQSRTGNGFDQYSLDNIWSWLVVSAFAIAGMMGSLFGGVFAEKLGRRRGMMLNAVIGLVGALLMGLSEPIGSYECIIIGRFVVGLCSGLYMVLVPLYLSEIAPMRMRGAIGVLNQLGVVLGLLVSQVLGLESCLGTPKLWPVLMGLAGFPCFVQLILLPLCSETPRYLLITRGQEQEARKALINLRGHSNVEAEVSELMVEAAGGAKSVPEVSYLAFLTDGALRTPLLIGVIMHLSQQLSGIGVIFTYSSTVFNEAGLSKSASGYATLGVGGIMVIMTGITIPLMDRVGRRPLHLTGLMGILVCSIAFTVSFRLQPIVSWFAYIAVVLALLVVVFFALGPGSIPWMITPELFGQSARSKAVSIGVAVNWSANFLVGALFPILQAGLGRLLFIPFSTFTLLFFIFLFLKLPETKNKSIEEIVSLFSKDGAHYGGIGQEQPLENVKTSF